MKQMNQKTIIDVTTERSTYRVVLERLKNTEYGCPRFEAIVICPNGYNTCWRFKGSYCGDRGEAEKAVCAHEELIKKIEEM